MPLKRNTTINALKTYINKEIVSTLKNLDLPIKKFSLLPPKKDEFGDLANEIKLNLTKKNMDNIEEITVTAPGFINFVIKPSFYQNKVTAVIKESESYGKDNIGKGKSANVEFVSANPTGPLTVGHGRNAVLGDTVSNILEWHGYKVTREYYYNDAGKQMRVLGESVASRYFELIKKPYEFPEEG